MSVPKSIPWAVLSLALVGFTSQGQPVEILPEADECAQCTMAVQDLKVASEAVFQNGDVKKFDDLGCMARYFKAKHVSDRQLKGVFVHDLATGTWVPLEKATLVQSRFPTPMRYGIVAFATPQGARKLDARYQGRVVTWSTILKGS